MCLDQEELEEACIVLDGLWLMSRLKRGTLLVQISPCNIISGDHYAKCLAGPRKSHGVLDGRSQNACRTAEKQASKGGRNIQVSLNDKKRVYHRASFEYASLASKHSVLGSKNHRRRMVVLPVEQLK